MTKAAGAQGTATRVATAAVLLPVVVASVWWGPRWLVALLAGLVTCMALWELFAIGERQGLRGYRVWTLVCALGLILSQISAEGQRIDLAGGAWLQTETATLPMELVLLAFVLGLAVGAVAGRRALNDVLPSVGASAAGLLVVALPLSFIVRLHGMDDGRLWLLFTLALVWAGDSVAYFVGRAVGRMPLAPQISPKKTLEGAVGNLLGSLLAAAVFSRWLEVGVAHLVLVTVLANVAGQIGDLAESAYKRGAGVKDSGALLPGHGGILDRIDALILAAPVVWAYVTLVR